MHTDGVTVFSQWPLRHFFDYIFSFDSIVSNLQYPRECQGEPWIIVRGDGLPGAGESWCQMSISFANHGHLARTLSYHWTVNVALCGEKSTSVLSQVWANNVAFLQSALASGVVPIRGASRRCSILCGGDSPWLRLNWLSGVTTHWMAGSQIMSNYDRHSDLLLCCPFFFVVFYFFVTAFSFLYYCWNRGPLM